MGHRLGPQWPESHETGEDEASMLCPWTGTPYPCWIQKVVHAVCSRWAPLAVDALEGIPMFDPDSKTKDAMPTRGRQFTELHHWVH